MHTAGTIVKLQARIPEVLMEGSKLVLGVEQFEFKWTPDQEAEGTYVRLSPAVTAFGAYLPNLADKTQRSLG